MHAYNIEIDIPHYSMRYFRRNNLLVVEIFLESIKYIPLKTINCKLEFRKRIFTLNNCLKFRIKFLKILINK